MCLFIIKYAPEKTVGKVSMNKGRVKYRSDNHGLTLIELIVTIGIIGIFIGVVSTFLSTTSNTYRGTSNNSKVQMETQETFDKLEDVIINANRNLAYGTSSGQIGDDINGKDGACSTVSKIFMVSSGEDSDVVNLSEEDDDMPAVNSEDTVMTATAENGSSFGSESGENVADKAATSNSKADDETVRDYFIWDQPSGEVRYIHSEKVNGQWQNYNEDPNGDILATGVMDFRADISKAVSDKIVRFQLRTKSGTKTIETLHSVSLRNDLGVSSQIDSPFVNPTGAPKPSVKPTDTPVPTEPPKPTGLTLNKSTVLLAAGTNLNMSNMEISGTVNYNDGTTSSAGSLTWTIDSNCTYATLNGGVIHIQENAGTASSGTVTLTATDTEHNNVSAQMTVYIARLDFSAPANNSSYTVGQEKQLQYTYLEGGKAPSDAQSIANVMIESKPQNAGEYKSGEKFVQNDIGSWKMNATVDVSKRSGYDFAYGSLTASTMFTVIGGWNNDIIINQNTAIGTIIAGRTYQCAPTVNWGFNFAPQVDGFWENSIIEWSVKDPEKNPGVSMQNGNITSQGKEAALTVGSEVKKGFTICAKYIKYTDASKTKVVTSISAEKQVNVANGIEITPESGTAYAYEPNDPLYSSEEFLFDVELNIYDINGTKSQIKVSGQDGTKLHWYNLGSGTIGEGANGNWRYYASVYNVGSTLPIKASLEIIPNIFDPKSNFGFEDSVNVTVAEPLYTAKIIPEGDETIGAGTSKDLYLQLVDKNNNLIDREVTWSVNNDSNKSNLLSATTSRTGEDSKITFTPKAPGTYVISATYPAITNKPHTVTKKITVGKPEVHASINGPDTVLKNSSENYWLDVKVGEEKRTDLNITWKWKHSSSWSDPLGQSSSSESSPVSVNFNTNDSTYELVAEFTLYGETYAVSKNITIRKPNVELQIHGNSQVSKLSQEHYWLSAQVEGELQTNLDVYWKWEHNQQWIENVGTSKSLESSLVTVNFGTDNTYRLRAEVTVCGDVYYTTLDITLQDPQSQIELRDENNQTESAIYVDQTVNLTANIKVNGKDYSVDDYRWDWKCFSQSDNLQQWNVLNVQGNKAIFNPSGSTDVKKGGIFIITVSCKLYNNDTVIRQASYRVTVKPFDAEIYAVNNKVSLFPGESTQLYLVLRSNSGIVDAQGSWSVENNALNLQTRYQNSTYSNGNIVPITVTANSNITKVENIIVTMEYWDKRWGTSGRQEINITITPLTLTLTSSADQIYYGNNPVNISADIVDAQNDQHITNADGYSIEWSLNPALNEFYELDTTAGANVQLTMKKAPDKSIPVTVTAVAKKSENIVCTASKIITVNPKTTIEKAYNCPADLEQKLEFNSEHQNKEIQSIKTSYMTSTGNEPIECKQDDLKILTFDSENMKVQMNSSAENFASYKYVKISADLGDVLYNFYIYPVQNNVYDYEVGKGSADATAYAPTDIESIRKLCVLKSNDKDEPIGYTYTYSTNGKLNDSNRCELRFSVYSKTGVGYFDGNYVDSSANKWFMRRRVNKEWVYYRLEGNKWYYFHNGDDTKDLMLKAQRTRFYWNLSNGTHLFDSNGKEIGETSNTFFWKKWN